MDFRQRTGVGGVSVIMFPSTSHPEMLPSIGQVQRITKSIAMLDAIVCPEWDYRYYSYNSKWGPGEEMASMRDGSGNDWFLFFGRFGAALKGFVHESKHALDSSLPRRLQKAVPAVFKSFLDEPAFSMSTATFCLWRCTTDSIWNVVLPENNRALLEDGSKELLCILNGDPRTYHSWAQDYYEQTIPFEGVQAIYEHQPLKKDLVSGLNPEISFSAISKDALEIGYPITQPPPASLA